MALVVAFIPSGGVLDASAGDEPCCPPEDDGRELPADQDCCPSDCSVCLLVCCAAPASLIASPVTLDGGGENSGTPALYRSDFSRIDSKGIYHPPRL